MKVGILGAGQLARMMILNSKALGLDFVLFCEKVTETTKNLAEHVIASFDDKEALEKFCYQVDIVTFESENIPEEAVDFILERKTLFPPKEALLVAQDRLLEKRMAQKLGVPTNNFKAIDSYEGLKKASDEISFPLVLKARRFGYDGKFQYRVKRKEDLLTLKNENLKGFLVESFVDFSHEVSIIGVRNNKGDILCYDLCKNHHEDGILRKSENIQDKSLLIKAKVYLKRIMEEFNYVGILSVEFFVSRGDLIFNEMAPRVHNSGHWTIEGAKTSQFENHVRAICSLPLGDTSSLGNCTMFNAITVMPDLRASLLEGVFYHDYQKAPRENRKLGHLTFFNN